MREIDVPALTGEMTISISSSRFLGAGSDSPGSSIALLQRSGSIQARDTDIDCGGCGGKNTGVQVLNRSDVKSLTLGGELRLAKISRTSL